MEIVYKSPEELIPYQNKKKGGTSIRICLKCKDTFTTSPSNVKIFCSKECKHKHLGKLNSGENNPYWRGGHKNYRGNFETIKREHFNKLHFCAVCGTLKHIHIHHIVPYRYTSDNSLENLIPLCRCCHRKVENLTQNIINAAIGYDNMKSYLGNILRSRQQDTTYVLKEIVTESMALNGR